MIGGLDEFIGSWSASVHKESTITNAPKGIEKRGTIVGEHPLNQADSAWK
jgi:hypothetical protein